MIKICHIVNHITGRADGVYTHLKMIFRCTDKNKFQHYLIFQGGEKVERELTEMGIKVFVSESLKKKISIKAFVDIYKFMKGNDIHIIHAHLVKPYAIAGLVNIFLRRKFIFNYNGLFIYKNIYYGLIEKIIYGLFHYIINLFKTIDIVLVPSKRSRELLLEETKLFPDPIVYYNGFDLKNDEATPDKNLFIKINEIKKESFVLAVVARLERQKRIDKAIELFKEVSEEREKTSLMIFGDGDTKEDLIKYVSELGLKSKVFFFDFVQNVSSYFSLFDILLFTSDWEGMPLTVWEAMANKLPIVAPDVGGFKEILEENNCGLVFKPDDLGDAEIKLWKLIEDESLRKKLGENGFRVIKEKYNSNNFIRQIENIYLNLSVK